MRSPVIFAAFAIAGTAFAEDPPPTASSQPATASSQPARTASSLLTPSQLAQKDQALGWWLSGSGAIGLVAGTATLLMIAPNAGDGSARDLGLATGFSFAGLGAGFLIAGIYTLLTGDPGPCETHGTALDAE